MSSTSSGFLRALSRRSLFGGAALTAGASALVLATRGAGAASRIPFVQAPEPTITAFSLPFVAYVRDPLRGELSLMVGPREIVRHDPELVARLLKLAQ